MAHVGLKRRTFDSLIRPRVTPIRVGTSLIFDVHDLDRAFDELKAASQAPDTLPAPPSRRRMCAGTDGPFHRKELNHGPISTGIHPDEGGTWQVDKIWRGTRFRQRGFTKCWRSAGLADQAARRAAHRDASRCAAQRTFDQAAAHYVTIFQDKVSIETARDLLAQERDATSAISS